MASVVGASCVLSTLSLRVLSQAPEGVGTSSIEWQTMQWAGCSLSRVHED